MNAASRKIAGKTKFALMADTTLWCLGQTTRPANLVWHIVYGMLRARVPQDITGGNTILLPQLVPEPGEVVTRRMPGK